MSNDPTTTPPAAAEQTPAGGTSSPAPTGGEIANQQGAQGETITRAEAAQLREEVRKAASFAQSSRDLVKNVTKEIAHLRALGKEITPAEEKSLKDAAIQQAMLGTEPETAGQLPPEAGGQQAQVDPEILAIQNKHGVLLYEGDPELLNIDRTHGNYAFYQSVDTAAAKKAARLASTPSTTNPASRITPTGNPPSGITPEMPAREAWQRVEHKT